MSLAWTGGDGCHFSTCRRFFIAQVSHGGGIAWDAWSLLQPQAYPVAGTPFTTLELAKSACETLQENSNG